jgi:uncharacterized protein
LTGPPHAVAAWSGTAGLQASIGVEPWVVVACGAAILLGAVVQGVVGTGLALVAVPVLAWLAPGLVPVGILVAAMPIAVTGAIRERAHMDVPAVSWAMAGRLPGGLLGAVAVAMLPVRGLQVLVATTVLLAVLAAVVTDARSVGEAPRRPRRSTIVLAGVLSGVGGTTSGIGGPPIAIVFRNVGGPAIRSTLSLVLMLGAVLSMLSLALVGEVTLPRLAAGAALIPLVMLGYVVAGRLRGRLNAAGVRVFVLVVSSVAGLGLLVDVVTG